MKILKLSILVLLMSSCNQKAVEGTTPPVSEISPIVTSLNIIGFKSVTTFSKDGETIVMFDPYIPRDDTAMSYAFLEIGEQVFQLKKKPWPKQDIVDVGQGKAIRYKYQSKTLLFMPIKNDDGTIHTVTISEE